MQTLAAEIALTFADDATALMTGLMTGASGLWSGF
jgi:hypothetical protein